mmetsp:Transcript_1566/g.2259  ORF Transcript_1566/g.2259 Transcript_1566/m.2259 type:complete len:100 (-) Transcript_1566:31-330(-)
MDVKRVSEFHMPTLWGKMSLTPMKIANIPDKILISLTPSAEICLMCAISEISVSHENRKCLTKLKRDTYMYIISLVLMPNFDGKSAKSSKIGHSLRCNK